MPQTDAVIIGSGIAALSAAYQLQSSRKVTILTKSTKYESNSMLAQGGIAAAVDKYDSWKDHYEDTMIAGSHHNDAFAAELLVKQGAKAVLGLIKDGFQFDRDLHGHILLGQEGAHKFSRILHAGGDATGKAVIQFLLSQLNENTEIIEDEMALDLIIIDGICRGAVTRNAHGDIKQYFAGHTILATGGCGSLYKHTSNSLVTSGDGLAMAFRAGAVLTDMEFTQFHPTMLLINGECVGLISEAVRGEGAFLQNECGIRVMEGIHEFEDLAPRDIVARTIFSQMKKGHRVFLNISSISAFESRFPTISAMCKKHGVNLEEGLIPVAPGMHFLMGGIKTDIDGKTSVSRLFAVGEAACTGVHGANRLASNSLLEGLVFGSRLGMHILNSSQDAFAEAAESAKTRTGTKQDIIFPSKEEIKWMMTNFAAIERSEEGLSSAKCWFEKFLLPISFWDINVNNFTNEEYEKMNMMTAGWLIVASALRRTESRGGHFRTDYPYKEDRLWLKKQILLSKYDTELKNDSEVMEIEFT
ncbi:L-aspartate oxidase [Metabacillus idriensis]|uniref:L-aspartate oxidase n=1 Tax=Metabacillus idriensis TaxID=324768 RepID=UPI003D2A6DB3